ncbi:MAG: HNH endonuclease [Saprospiraceae bacterium]
MGRAYLPKETKRLVFERASFTCEYCFSLDQYSSSPFNVEHIIPVSKSGGNDIKNLALACHGCNAHKYNKMFGMDKETMHLAPLYNPQINEWHKHFKWNEAFTIIIGLTPIGRATIETLHLNRFRLLNQRFVFRKAGLHPPKFTLPIIN